MTGDSDNKKSQYNAYRKRWLSEALGDDFVNTYAHLSKDDHARVQQLAKEHQQRIPKLIGVLVRVGLDIVALKQPQLPEKAPERPAPNHNDIAKLTDLVLNSRFPGDTGAARFRVLAVLNLIDLETRQGRVPTGNQIAVRAETHPSYMNFLTRVLEKRGLIVRTPLPHGGTGGTRRAYGLAIRPDAIEALQKAHIEEAGFRIGEAPPAPSSDSAGS